LPEHSLNEVLRLLDTSAAATRRPVPRLLAVSKTQTATAVSELAAALRRAQGDRIPAFGENYVQEAASKQAALAEQDTIPPPLEWHLIGHLQSNKAKDAARLFDWVQTVDRGSLVTALARHRPPDREPLNVLLQVNVDDEAGKHGCRPEDLATLADAVAGQPGLRLRGLMVIPTPHADIELRRPAFRRTRALFDELRQHHPGIDTLSMGMSDDCAIAVAEGATMVRVGTALFGARPKPLASEDHA